MIDKHHQELIHRHLDGELTAAERVELELCLHESSSARAFYERMSLLKQAGERRVDVPAPAGLRSEVMSRVRGAIAKPSPTSSLWSDIRNALSPIFVPRLAYGIAAGIVLGFTVGALTLWDGGVRSGSQLDYSGTLGLPQTADPVHIKDDHFSNAGLSVEWSVDRLDNQLLLRLDINSIADSRVALAFDPEQIAAQGFSQGGPELARVEMSQGTIRAVVNDHASFAILFHGLGLNPEPIDLQVVMGGSNYKTKIPVAAF